MTSTSKVSIGFKELPSIMPKIFTDLPPETLAKCRCVCKNWNLFIISLLLRFDGNDDDNKVEAHIRFLRETLPSKVHAHKNYEKNLRLQGLEPGKRYVDAMSLLEICSVTIHPTVGTTCEIYGTILVKDELGNSLTLYDRIEEKAELVSNLGFLSLDVSICPARPLTISVDLSDKIGCVNIANGEFRLSYSKEEDYDEELWCEDVYGACGYASVSYRSFRSAVVAEISVACHFDLDAGKRAKRAIYGTICTRLGDLYRKYAHYDKNDDHILVRNKQDVPLTLSHGGLIELSKTMVVVPACSSLRPAMRLNACEDMSIIADGYVEFNARDDDDMRREFFGLNDEFGQNDECVVAVDVKWSLGDHIFPSMKVMDREILRRRDIGIIEIFSFSLGCSNENIRLLGKIQVCSNLDNFNIFEGDGNFANNACVSWPKRPVLAVGDLRIKFNLRDAQGRQICKGYVLPSEFASRRRCSVVRGNYGCAAIHYAIIKDPMIATIAVKVFAPDLPYTVNPYTRTVNVAGIISTRYGDSEYKTYYDRTYYESILFKRHGGNSVTLSYGEEIPFVKSVVPVPKNSPLIVMFGLELWRFGGSPDPELWRRQFVFEAVFEAFNGDPAKNFECYKLVGDGFWVAVEVTWESNIQAFLR